jgi:choline dehydrogenase-like flavoprotein
VLGGCSATNAMAYVRGNKKDYDDWAALGNEGWDYASVLPYFKKSENNQNFDNEFHGKDGPMYVSHASSHTPVAAAFVAAGAAVVYFANYIGPFAQGVLDAFGFAIQKVVAVGPTG